MINLIPNQEKKKKVKDFYFRFFIIFIATLAVSTFVAVISILPVYFLTSIEKNFASAKLEEQKNTPETPADQNLAAKVADLNNKLAIVERARENAYPVSRKIIFEITERKMPDIKITKILYEKDPQGSQKVLVQGVAASRERLLLFRQALEDDAYFKNVDLPISNFVKGSNIQFSLRLVPA